MITAEDAKQISEKSIDSRQMFKNVMLKFEDAIRDAGTKGHKYAYIEAGIIKYLGISKLRRKNLHKKVLKTLRNAGFSVSYYRVFDEETGRDDYHYCIGWNK